jgi:hypothetical protein
MVTTTKQGTVYVKAYGNTYSVFNNHTYIWDDANLYLMPIENAAVFIPTRMKIERGYEMGTCVSDTLNCTTDSDCSRATYT